MKIRVENKIIKIALYYIIFLLAYTLNIYLESIIVLHAWLKDHSTLQVIIALLSRLLIWPLPVFLLLNKPFDYLKLRKHILKGIASGVMVGILLCLLQIVGLYLFKGSVDINLTLTKHLWWEVILFVGLSEEVVFRG